MADLVQTFEDWIDDIVEALPSILAAIIILIIGFIAALLISKLVNKVVMRSGLASNIEQTQVGRSMKQTGADPGKLLGGVIGLIIAVLTVMFAIQVLEIGGDFGNYLNKIATYLPELLAGILIITFGAILVDFLATFIGKLIRPMFAEDKAPMAEALRNVLFIGLLAFVLYIGLDTMRLPGDMIYPLILAVVVVGWGISLTDALICSIVKDHAEFSEVAGYAKFVLYSIFLLVGTSAMFAGFPGVTNILANVSWAVVLALALLLIPVVATLTFKMIKKVG